MILRWTVVFIVLLSCLGCASRETSADVQKNRVVVLGMIHSRHRTSATYSLDVLRDAIVGVEPNVILTEIPPDRFEIALTEFQFDGRITEQRVSRFPEYVDVLFPLTNHMPFEIVPCAAWTKDMADARQEKLRRWQETRPNESKEVEEAQRRVEAIMQAEFGDLNDPLAIHSERYDELVAMALEPYDRLFNDDLGAGGWTNINTAHYELIDAALDRYAGRGITILITFGSWHKYWFLKKLRTRSDIVLVEPCQFFKH